VDFAQGGELFFLLREEGQLSEKTVKFYIAQIILALEHLHSLGIVYRDLKPENLLLDDDGNILLTDFGLAKMVLQTNSFCGTPDYIPPEIIENKEYTRSVDWWQLGILIYELLVGHTPFFHHNINKMFNAIRTKSLRRNHYLSEDAFDLISKLLKKNPNKRIGNSEDDAKPIKEHPFFKDIDWNKILQKEIKPPLDVEIKKLRYFDKKSLVIFFLNNL
jgi:serine/threonine protein kinase